MYLPEASFGSTSAKTNPLLLAVAGGLVFALDGLRAGALLTDVRVSVRFAAADRRGNGGMMARRIDGLVRSSSLIPVMTGLPLASVLVVCVRNLTKMPRAPCGDRKISPPSWFGPFSR